MFATPSYGKSAMPRDDAARIRDIVEADLVWRAANVSVPRVAARLRGSGFTA
jgi:hypothetical protein